MKQKGNLIQGDKMSDGLFGLLSGFDALAGIGEAREVRGREETLLEKLINLEQVILLHAVRYVVISKFSNRVNQLLNEPENELNEDVLISSLYSCLAKELRNVEFTENDIKEYILARANNNDEYSVFSGLLSGILLSTLTERNNLQGKRTKCYIDGKGNCFDYLFAFARTVDELVVENFCGDYICSCIGSNGGVANKIVGLNIKGNHALGKIGRANGKVGLVLGRFIEGRNALSSIGEEGGDVKYVIGFDIEGNSALAHIGNNKGKIGLVCGYNITGRRALASICSEGGKCGVIFGTGIKGDDALSFSGNDNGNIGLVYGLNINGEGTLNYVASKKGNVRLVIGENIANENNNQFGGGVLSNISNDCGHVDIVVGNKITDRNALSFVGSKNGTIGKLIAIAVKGEDALSYIGCGLEKISAIRDYIDACSRWEWYKTLAEGTKHQFELEDVPEIKNPPNFIGEGYDAIGEVLCDPETDVTPTKICCKKLVIGNEALEEYERIMKEHKLNELVETVRNMYGQPYQEVMEIVESLRFKEMLK